MDQSSAATARREQIENDFLIVQALFKFHDENNAQLRRLEKIDNLLDNEIIKRIGAIKKKYNIEFRIGA